MGEFGGLPADFDFLWGWCNIVYLRSGFRCLQLWFWVVGFSGSWAWLGDGLGGFWVLVVGCGFVFWGVV